MQVAAVSAAYAGALALSPPHETWSDDLGRWVMTIGTLIAAGWLVRALTSRVVEREQRLRAGFDGSNIGLATLDLFGNYVTVNPACERMLVYSADALLELNTKDLTHPDDWPAVESAAWAVATDGEPRQYEARYVHGDGTSGWGWVHLSLVRDEDGNTTVTSMSCERGLCVSVLVGLGLVELSEVEALQVQHRQPCDPHRQHANDFQCQPVQGWPSLRIDLS